ncbi:beta-glucan synthesis-associated [Amanita rubescens]|nr:beta-glucan synthesis-associated [Amanita rubescens]
MSAPASAVYSAFSRAKYNYALSWLPGQRLSACSCPNSDHPGPSFSIGRGAPEIDLFEVEKDKVNPTGQVASQSAQFAPFTHDYVYGNDTRGRIRIEVQQGVSSLATVPGDMFQGSGAVFHTMGFEYWADPSDRPNNFITWQVDGSPSYRLGASAVGPDTGTGGTGVGQRLIPEEPMSIVLNLGISPNWQTIDLTTMIFPAELRIDYVRVYQRKGSKNVGCDPAGYPTMEYINNHIDAYTNPNMTTWEWPIPTNSAYNGGC